MITLYYSDNDKLITEYNLYKIKTILASKNTISYAIKLRLQGTLYYMIWSLLENSILSRFLQAIVGAAFKAAGA